MPSNPSTPRALPDAVLALLACPVCHGSLHDDEGSAIRCAGCGRVYPVRDGIPVLIAGESTGGKGQAPVPME